MQIVRTVCYKDIPGLRAQIKHWREAGESIAFVPTMGNLHAGHMQLVAAAKAEADRVVVSVFVNPTQFGEGEDFSSYPRTIDADVEQLQNQAVDAVFMPEIKEMYSVNSLTRVHVSQLTENHCGVARPGHFDGVATVVCKLFNIVQPDKAFFGEKDFQQLVVIRTMVADLNFPVEIMSVPTWREVDGLAMSSRNSYLTSEQRAQAAKLYQALCHAKQAVLSQQMTYSEIEKKYCKLLTDQGFDMDYFSVCRQQDLQAASSDDKQLIILSAGKLGKTRLIDNILLDVKISPSH